MSDPFHFEAAAETEKGVFDLSQFEPRVRPVDRRAAEAGRAVAQDAGFTTRRRPTKPAAGCEPSEAEAETAPAAPEPPPPAAPSAVGEPKPNNRPKARITVSELLGLEDKYPDAQRAQLNMLTPVPVYLRWRRLVGAGDRPAWEVLEDAMDALERQASDKRGGRS